MKIIGYQKDFFDSMIYTYGIDESLRLDRTLYIPSSYMHMAYRDRNYKEKVNKDYPFMTEKSGLKNFLDANKFYDHIEFSWRSPRIEGEAQTYKELMYLLKYDRSDYSRDTLYFDGYLYHLYYKKRYENRYSAFAGEYKYPIELDSENVMTTYKGAFNLLCYEDGTPVKVKASEEIVAFSKKFKLPYFSFIHDFFFPFLAIKDHEKYFDIVDVYQKVENFLLNCTIEEMETQSNENKITAHGFDTVKSFRNMK